jgi:hypothetical protein
LQFAETETTLHRDDGRPFISSATYSKEGDAMNTTKLMVQLGIISAQALLVFTEVNPIAKSIKACALAFQIIFLFLQTTKAG